MATTIAVSKETKKMLDAVARKDETYDEALHRVLQQFGEEAMHEKWDKLIEEGDFIPFEFRHASPRLAKSRGVEVVSQRSQ